MNSFTDQSLVTSSDQGVPSSWDALRLLGVSSPNLLGVVNSSPPRSLPTPNSFLTFDANRETRRERSAFAKVRNAEREYATRLRQVARQVGILVRAFFSINEEPTTDVVNKLTSQLQTYAHTITPWAEAVARRMLQDVQRRDIGAWARHAKTMSRALRAEIDKAPTGRIMQEALTRQVDLITSLPRDAATRVQNLALTGFVSGRRVGEIRYGAEKAPEGLAKDILLTGSVTVSRANLIARTETSRVATELLKSRAQFVGSEGYIWRTSLDKDVRAMHKKLEGTFHRWDEPPIAETSGERHHPGEFPNCRCTPEVIIPDKIR